MAYLRPGVKAGFQRIGTVHGQPVQPPAAFGSQRFQRLGKGGYFGPAGRHRLVLGVGIQVSQLQPAQTPKEDRPAPVQRLQGFSPAGRQRRIVHGHQRRHAVPKPARRAQTLQNQPGHLGAALVVAGKVRGAVRRFGAAERFGQIMQQRGPAKYLRPVRVAGRG